MDPPLSAVLFALLLVLAGCNGFTLGGSETSTQRVTPANVPTDEPTPTPIPQLAPGVTGKGVTEPERLGEAHESILENISYTVDQNVSVRYLNGTIYRQRTSHIQHAMNDGRFYLAHNRSLVSGRGSSGFSAWSNGKRTLVARSSNNTTRYLIPPQGSLSFGSPGERIAALFGSVETHVVAQEQRDGITVYRVKATGLVRDPPTFANEWQNPRDVTLRALIDSRGFVYEYQLSYEATVNGVPIYVYEQVRYTDLRNTTVERPPWYEEAIENVSTTTASTTVT